MCVNKINKVTFDGVKNSTNVDVVRVTFTIFNFNRCSIAWCTGSQSSLIQ